MLSTRLDFWDHKTSSPHFSSRRKRFFFRISGALSHAASAAAAAQLCQLEAGNGLKKGQGREQKEEACDALFPSTLPGEGGLFTNLIMRDAQYVIHRDVIHLGPKPGHKDGENPVNSLHCSMLTLLPNCPSVSKFLDFSSNCSLCFLQVLWL